MRACTLRSPGIGLVLAVLAGCGVSPSTPRPTPEVRARHAVVIVVDALRADALARARTPVLDALAEEARVAPLAWGDGTWTGPSVTSLFTGMSVREHGWDVEMGAARSLPVLPAAPTLAEVLRDEGFATAGVYGNPVLSLDVGFERGFATWEGLDDDAIPAWVAGQVASWDDGRRHFLYVHLLGPHSPLEPSEAARARWSLDESWFDSLDGFKQSMVVMKQRPGAEEAYEAAYHAVVEDTDARLGEILTALEPYLAETALVITADHGELLGEHGEFGHGPRVWEQLTRVPLLTLRTGPLPERVNLSALPDLVCATLGLSRAWPIRIGDPSPLVSQRGGRLAIHDGRHKGIWDGELRVYAPADDPEEATPLDGLDADFTALRAAWEDRIPPGPVPTRRATGTPETVEALERLGYLETASPR